MGAWQDADVDLSRTISSDTGFGVAASFQPKAGGSAVAIKGSIEEPPMLEPFAPGSSQGTSVVHFFVYMPDISPRPQKGDGITLNGIAYDIFEKPETENAGCTLHLRRNA